MKKFFLTLACIVLAVILIALLIAAVYQLGGNNRSTPTLPAETVIFDGDRYVSTGKQLPVEVDESAIVGHITLVLPGNRLPMNEGEANFGTVGDPFAITSEGFLVLLDNEWTLFRQIPD